MRRERSGKKCFNLYKIPIPLAIEEDTLFTWWPQDKCLSIVMPRNLTWSFGFKGRLSIIMFCGKATSLRVVWKCIKCVLLIFNDNLLHLNHEETLINSKFIILINSIKFLWDNKMLVSSANKTNDKMGEELTIPELSSGQIPSFSKPKKPCLRW